jgi:hypothetical protein
MTNLELAQQQGNQAAPNLLDAAAAGELGGGSSKYPSLSTASAVMAYEVFSLDTDQATEAAANTIYNNCKLVTDNHLDLFILIEEYLPDGAEYSEASRYYYYAFSARALAHFKNLATAFPEEFPYEIFDNIEPDELCTFEDEIAGVMVELTIFSLTISVDELPPAASGLIMLDFTKSREFAGLVPTGSSIYAQIKPAIFLTSSPAIPGVLSVQYYAESLLDVPVKLDKVYSIYSSEIPLPML